MGFTISGCGGSAESARQGRSYERPLSMRNPDRQVPNGTVKSDEPFGPGVAGGTELPEAVTDGDAADFNTEDYNRLGRKDTSRFQSAACRRLPIDRL